VLLAQLVHRGQLVQLGLRAHKESKASQGRWGQPALKVLKDLLALPAQPELKAFRAQPALKVPLAQMV
jgi:hypothetical protein